MMFKIQFILYLNSKTNTWRMAELFELILYLNSGARHTQVNRVLNRKNDNMSLLALSFTVFHENQID